MYNEEDVDAWAYLPYYEVENAIENRGVTEVAIFGYSQGGGATEVLSEQLDDNRGDIGTFTIEYTAYIDGVDHDGAAQENARPAGSLYHANYYQNGVLNPLSQYFDNGLDGGPIDDPPGADYEIDVENEPAGTPWSPNATHYNVRGVQTQLITTLMI